MSAPIRVLVAEDDRIQRSLLSEGICRAADLELAGLAADGCSVVEDVEYIMRGYENFAEKLRELGAEIRLADDDKDVQKFKLARSI